MYKDVHKDISVDGHEQSDIVENRANFLNKIEELKPYIVEFYDDGAMKSYIYLSDCALEGENR